jgi:hypothetical protein
MSAIVLPYPLADPPRSRPLSSISTPKTTKPLPPLPVQPHYVPAGSGPSTSRPSLALAPSAWRPVRRSSICSLLQQPRILACFLRHVHWHDFQSLALTCSACRNVLHHPKLRDAVLSRFVPGYRYCLRHADVNTVSSIDVQFGDLSYFSEYCI